jgi:clan AA aspartic protease (TIGR02281 family)
MRRIAAVLALSVFALPAGGEIYRWTDSQGRVHFTQDLSQVPPDQRPRAVERTLDDSEGGRISTYSSDSDAAPPAHRAPAIRTPETSAGRPVHRIRVERAGTSMMVAARLNNSVVVPFVVDTGATDVSIPRWAAAQLGLRDSGRTRQYITANGMIEESVVMLESVDLGGARVEDVPASISSTMDVGLLGLSFFNHFTYHVDTARGVLTLVPNDLAESGQIRGGRSEAQWRSEFGGLRARLRQVDTEMSRTNSNASSKRQALDRSRSNVLAQLELLEGEADQARVPMAWRE